MSSREGLNESIYICSLARAFPTSLYKSMEANQKTGHQAPLDSYANGKNIIFS